MKLQTRLAVGLLVSLVFALFLQWWVADRALDRLLENNTAQHLEDDAELVLAALRLAADGTLGVDPTRINTYFTRPFSGHYYQIQSPTEQLRSRSLWDQELILPQVGTGQSARSEAGGPSGQKLLLVTRGFNKFDRAVVVAVGEDITDLEAEMRSFQWRFAILALVILFSLVGLQMAWLRRGLRPLESISAELRALEHGATGKLTVANVPAEVQPLVLQINRLLEIIQRRLERSRNALGNLAHALKTPLTALMQHFESPEIAHHPELQKQLSRHTEVVRELIERELKRARVVGAALPTRYYDFGTEIAALIQTLRMVYRDKNVTIETALPADTRCPMDREDLLELLGNLLDNACKWTRAQVRLTVVSGPDWTFTIEDDGPGVADAELTKLAQRGVRIDEGTAGHGLGLAIAKDLATLYGGDMTLGRSSSLGGFLVTARIPLSMT